MCRSRFPDLGGAPASSIIPAYLSGSAQEIAAAMYDLDRMGAPHLMVFCAPYNLAALERLADAVRAYREERVRA